MGNGTSIGKVRGLGSAHHGAHHWLVQRFTAVGNLVLALWFIGSLLLLIGTFGLFLWERLHDVSIDQARTVAVNTLVMFEVFYLFNTRSLKTPIWRTRGFFANRTVFLAVATVLGAQLLFTYLPFMQNLFKTTAISPYDWLRVILITMPVLLIVEVEKVLLAR